jgi:glycerol-3-phosphate acyltransferase PlsY
VTPALLVVLAYLTGAFPTSYIGARMRGVDLRKHGSGNLGATNAFRVLGWRVALPVMLVDVLKGWFPTYFFPVWAGVNGSEWALAYGAAAILGHVFSPYVRFKGGKGVATGAGVFLALCWQAVLAGTIVWAIIVYATRIVSLASIAAALVVPIVVYVTQGPGSVFALSLAMGAFVLFSHRANIRRLMRGEEHRFVKAKEAR